MNILIDYALILIYLILVAAGFVSVIGTLLLINKNFLYSENVFIIVVLGFVLWVVFWGIYYLKTIGLTIAIIGLMTWAVHEVVFGVWVI